MKHIQINRIIILALLLHFAGGISAQNKTIYGIVTNETDELLTGASVYWKDRSAGTSTDISGVFRLPAKSQPDSLIVHYTGYTQVSIEVLPGEDSLWVVIQGITALQGVEIVEHQFGNSISTLDPRNVESIGSKELKKAPCCNLSESFETNGSVDLAFPNAITGIKEIQMLGLRGIYSQFMVENRPTMSGIATPFAFELIPGTWLNGIQLAKGASSVVNGNSGITGQINADLVKPLSDKPVFVNLFTSTEGRAEANIHLNKVKNKSRANGLLLHGSFVENKWDRNNDQFYDMPNRRQLNALYRNQYESEKVCAQFNIQALTDTRQSGQIRPFEGQQNAFEVHQQNDRVEAWGKYGIENIGGKHFQQLGNMYGVSWHRAQAQFGPNRWNASQQSVYLQSLYQNIIGTTDHKYVLAPSLQWDNIAESVNETILDRKELVPGIMGEYTYARPNLDLGISDITVVAGARLDWNSRFQRWLFTPRVSAKYNFTTETVARISAGKGYRSPHLVAENLSMLAGNRAIIFESTPQLESAINYGVNFTHQFKVFGKSGSISADYYRTDFQNQIIMDVDQSPLEVSFYSTNGAKAYSQIALIMAQYNFFSGFEAKISAKWQDVKSTYSDGILRTAILTPRFRGLITLDYTTPNKKWMFNARSQWVGQQRLPDNSKVPHEYTHHFPETTNTYTLLAGQVTYIARKNMEIYLGGENLTGVQQHNAIIAYNEPESPYFNGSQLWAPMGGTVVYAGIRWHLN